MPRHIVCLTFDFDTQSGFIARGMTTPTALSRGEFGLIGARRILALLQGATDSRDLVRARISPSRAIPRACEAGRARTATKWRITAGRTCRRRSRAGRRRRPISCVPTRPSRG